MTRTFVHTEFDTQNNSFPEISAGGFIYCGKGSGLPRVLILPNLTTWNKCKNNKMMK